MLKAVFVTTLLLPWGFLSAPQPPSESFLIVAHRGASRDAPENTLPAFELAWRRGADAIEGDFHLTKDGKIVCIHDRDTEKVAGKKLIVKESRLAELRKLDVGSYRDIRFKGVVIPTIDEVFATVPPGKKIYVEVKCGVEIVPELLAAIQRSKLKQEQIIFISFQDSVIQAIKARAPNYQAYWLSGFKRDDSGQISPSFKTVLKTLRETGADGFSSSKDVIGPAFIKDIQQAGFQYHVWTVDDAATAEKFVDWGAQSITTNVPGLIKKHFQSRSVKQR